MAVRARLESSKPDMSLLLKHNNLLVPSSNNTNNNPEEKCIDRIRLNTLMSSSSSTCLPLRALADSLRHCNQQRFVSLNSCQWNQVVTSHSLSDLQCFVHDASFFSPLSNTDNAFLHLLCKVINIRCQGRKFADVAYRYIRSNNDLARRMRQLILCSLLGNYNHCREFHPTCSTRTTLYRIFVDKAGLYTEWIAALLVRCSGVVINAFREFMIDAIAASPSLETQVCDLMKLNEFRAIVTENMDRVRRYMDSFIGLPTSALHQALLAPSDPYSSHSLSVFRDLNALVHSSGNKILRISYRRPNRILPHFILSMRKSGPLIQPKLKQDDKIEDVIEQNEDEEDFEERLAREIEAAITSYNENEECDQDDDPADEKVSEYKDKVDRFLIPEHQRLVREIVTSGDRDVLKNAVSNWFPYMGAKRDTLDFVDNLIDDYHKGSGSIQRLKQRFQLVRSCDPHVYNLLQFAAEVVREVQRRYAIISLPHSYRKCQLEAVQSVFPSSNVIVAKMFMFVFCPICDRIYSLLRDFDSVYRRKAKGTYTHGYRDVISDYTTGEIYCRGTKHNQRGKCGETPLAQINLLGKMMIYKNKMILLCPQLECGAPMVLNKDKCEWNERGPACRDCTNKWKEQKRISNDGVLSEFLGENKTMKCIRCGNECSPATACVYPFGLFLCKKHSSDSFIQLALDSKATNAQELEKEIIDMIRLYRSSNKSRNEAKWKAMLNQHKSMRRNKKCQ